MSKPGVLQALRMHFPGVWAASMGPNALYTQQNAEGLSWRVWGARKYWVVEGETGSYRQEAEAENVAQIINMMRAMEAAAKTLNSTLGGK